MIDTRWRSGRIWSEAPRCRVLVAKSRVTSRRAVDLPITDGPNCRLCTRLLPAPRLLPRQLLDFALCAAAFLPLLRVGSSLHGIVDGDVLRVLGSHARLPEILLLLPHLDRPQNLQCRAPFSLHRVLLHTAALDLVSPSLRDRLEAFLSRFQVLPRHTLVENAHARGGDRRRFEGQLGVELASLQRRVTSASSHLCLREVDGDPRCDALGGCIFRAFKPGHFRASSTVRQVCELASCPRLVSHLLQSVLRHSGSLRLPRLRPRVV
mmetsp:Transcript_8249/g.31016  ORF Transcript_8249/g.31016 Transcript_8249/m.31016 type:complete len:265 (-) Transcript_8249:517-1311(-)